MAFDFKFPDVGEGIHEGKIVKWLVKEGDKVKADQAIAEVETDKAVVEIPSPRAGKISKLYHKVGEVIKVGETLASIEEDFSGAVPKEEKKESTGVVGSLEPTSAAVMKVPNMGGGAVFNGGSPFGSSGAVFGGQVSQKVPSPQLGKVEQSAGAAKNPNEGSMAGAIKAGIKAVKKYDLFGYIDRVPYDGVRKAIGDHIVQSIRTAPHVTHMETVDITELWARREKEKKEAEKTGIKLTLLSYIVRAVVAALKKHPFLNAMLDEENREIILRKYYNIGIAVDTEAGLMVPVLKGADNKDLYKIAKEIALLAEKARSRKINAMDFKGGTFTITNVGSAGSGKFFTPVINYPEAAILGIGLIEDAPLVRNGKIEVRKVMYISLSFDHRILDGAEAARFVKDLKDLLQGTGDGAGKVVPAAGPGTKKSQPKKVPAKRLIAKNK